MSMTILHFSLGMHSSIQLDNWVEFSTFRQSRWEAAGLLLPSQHWFLSTEYFSIRASKVSIFRMNALKKIGAFQEPVLSLHSVQRRNASEELLIGFRDRLSLVRLPELSAIKDIPFDRFPAGMLIVNSDWLVLILGTDSFPVGTNSYSKSKQCSLEIVGWKWESLIDNGDDIPPPEIRIAFSIEHVAASAIRRCSLHLSDDSTALVICNDKRTFMVNLVSGIKSANDEEKSEEPIAETSLFNDYQSFSLYGRTNLEREGGWLITSDGNLREYNPGDQDQPEWCKRYWASSSRITTWRNSLLPSPLQIWTTLFFPICFWSIFQLAISARIFFRIMGRRGDIFLCVFGVGTFVLIHVFLRPLIVSLGGNWIHFMPLILAVVAFSFAIWKVGGTVFREVASSSLQTISIAFPLSLIAWWVSFVVPMPPNAFLSLMATAIGIIVTLQSFNNFPRAAQPIASTKRFSRLCWIVHLSLWLSILFQGLHLSSLVGILYTSLYPHGGGEMGGAFGRAMAIEITQSPVYFAISFWLAAWFLQIGTRQFYIRLTTFSLILLVPELLSMWIYPTTWISFDMWLHWFSFSS